MRKVDQPIPDGLQVFPVDPAVLEMTSIVPDVGFPLIDQALLSAADYPLIPVPAFAFQDSVEGITHSLCTLEFEDHRPFFDADSHIMELPDFLKSYADPSIRADIQEVSYSASLVTACRGSAG